MEAADNSLRPAAELLSASFKHPGAVQKAAFAYFATLKYIDALQERPESKIIYAMGEMAYDRACILSEDIPKEEPTGLTISQILEQDYKSRAEFIDKANQLALRISSRFNLLNEFFGGVQIYPSQELSPFSMALERTAAGLPSLIEEMMELNSGLIKILSYAQGKAVVERSQEHLTRILQAYRSAK